MHRKSARRRVILYYDRLLFPAGTILTAPPLFSTQCPQRLCLADHSPCVTDGMQGNQQDCTVNVNRDPFRFLGRVDNGGLQDSVQQWAGLEVLSTRFAWSIKTQSETKN